MYSYTNNDNITFELECKNDNTLAITAVYTCGNASVIRFPDEYNGRPITEIVYSLALWESVREVVLSNNISMLPSRLFSSNENLQTVVWSRSAKNIPRNCFSFCYNLKEVKNIENVETIEESAFAYSGISFIDLSKTAVKTIGKEAFCESNIKEIIWPNSCTVIPEKCFSACKNFSTIKNLNAVSFIKSGAFERSSIEEIDMRTSKICFVEKYAFSFCDFLKTVTWSSQCTVIPENCFTHSSLSAIHNIKNVEIIEEGAFRYTKIKEIDLSKTEINFIGKEAFSRCSNLKSVVWPDNCTLIKKGTFAHCRNLNKLYNTDSVCCMEHYCFKDTGFTKIDFHSNFPNLYEIGMDSMCDCENLEEVIWPEKVSIICEGTFSGCRNLKTLKGVEGVTDIEKDAFKGVDNLNVDFSTSHITYINTNSFTDCKRTDNIKLPFYANIFRGYLTHQ